MPVKEDFDCTKKDLTDNVNFERLTVKEPEWSTSESLPGLGNVELFQTYTHNSVVCCVKFSPDGRLLAVGCNRAAFVYDLYTFSCFVVFETVDSNLDIDMYTRTLSFSHDGNFLITGSEDSHIKIWDLSNKCLSGILSGHEGSVYSLEFSADGRILASVSGDSVRIWDWKNYHCLHIICSDEINVFTSVAISPDSSIVASGSTDSCIYYWSVLTGELLGCLEGHSDNVYSLKFMPEEHILVSGSLDKTIRTWRIGIEGNECIKVLGEHTNYVLSVIITPDSKWIVSGSKDSSIKFWNTCTGSSQLTIKGHENTVTSVAVGFGSKHMLATGSGDYRACVWTYDPSK